MMQLLKPTCLKPVLHSKRSHCDEKTAHPNQEEPPLAATTESLQKKATKTQCSQKEKEKEPLTLLLASGKPSASQLEFSLCKDTLSFHITHEFTC